ncbi:C1q-related factor-like [Pollicipes pollicipes]|uniref:C1q-related factor-like n=1 Tax=Pollicipes pollicipes TaxID=41117 RepID=UPI0018855A0C|nr:C1q-related factor-like [Pollicipes pollicipes]
MPVEGSPSATVPPSSPISAVLGTFNPSSANHSTSTQVTAGPNDCRTVAFTVAKVNYQRRKAGTTGTQVVFDDMVTNVGHGWDAASSSFRCSCPGTYFFTFHVLSPAQGRARVDLMRNTRRVISAEANYGGFDTGSNSAVVQLVGGDVVYLWLAEGYLYENDARFRGFNSLSAYKIG